MTSFLLATFTATGHVAPFEPVARELRDRGHEVHWYTGSRHRERVEATGAAYVPMRHAPDVDASELDEHHPGRADLQGLALVRFDVRQVFLAALPGQVADLQAHLVEHPADVLLVDTALVPAAQILEERLGLVWACLGVLPLTLSSRDTAPFGLGLAPSRSTAGRLRNRLLSAVVRATVHRPLDRELHAVRSRLGASPRADGLFSSVPPYLHLQPTVPAFEYPRTDLPPVVHFVGPLLPVAPGRYERPAWWGDLSAGRPVVVVTQGTVATDPDDLLRPALRALAEEDVLVVAVTGGPDPATLGPVPANARVERHIPFAELLPHASVLVTNGGYGGVQFGLAHGVPVVVAGATEDKPEIVARVAWSGVGVGLRTKRPGVRRLSRAVRRVLDDPAFATRAGEVAAEMATHDAPVESADLLELLALTRRPVIRGVWPSGRNPLVGALR
jgi:MGT family glycosyltransferase